MTGEPRGRAGGITIRLHRAVASGPLRVKSFALLAAGQFMSNIGDMCYAIALPWLILSGHGSATQLGIVLGCYGLTRAVAIPVGGSLADRYHPRSVMIVTDVTRFCVTGALGALAVTGHPSLPILVVFSLIHGGCGGAFLPASQAILPDLVPEDQLLSANSVYSAFTQTGSLLGPAVGGIVVALAGSGSALLVDAVTFAVSASTLLAIHRAAGAKTTQDDGQVQGAAGQGEAESTGPSFATVLRQGKLLHAFIAAAFLLNLFFAGTTEVALPSLAHENFGAGGYGALLCGLAVGALGGAFAARIPWSADRPTLRMAAFTIVMGLALALVPFAGGVVGAVICMALVGAADSASGIQIMSMLQVWSPRQVLSRVMSTIMFGVMGLFPLSVVISGVLVRHLGPRDFFPVAGAVTLLAIVVALANPAFRRYRKGERFAMPAPAEPALQTSADG